ncbi:MAG: PEGA domain-containing protein [Candidatus Omnitrophica bacterium]|nr:PEGA domain-containing protein [Candidatus Omnitrophota bacterium]MDD5430101.1 PEGA domain-containing protein [Candidatus Omnitrophota bacterium]
MLFLRKILFYVFGLFYIILCPLIILYAFGFIFSPSSGGIIKTGLMYISTAPSGAVIFLSNRRYTKKTPAVLQNMLPGTYKLKITLDGRNPWERPVKVKPNQATVLDKILLIPQAWRQERLTLDFFEDLVPVSSDRFFILARSSRLDDYFVYDWRQERLLPLLGVHSQFQPAKVVSFFSVPQSPGLAACVSLYGEKKFLWLELKNGEVSLDDITVLFPENPARVEWDASNLNELFAFQGDYLNRLDIENKAVYPKYIERLKGFGVFNRSLYILRDINTLERMNYDKGSSEILLEDPILGKFLFGGKDTYQIKPLSDDIIAFLGSRGQLLSNRLPHRFIDKGVLGTAYDEPSKRLLFWQKDRVGFIDFSAEKTTGANFEKGPSVSWIYEGGKNISQAFWVYGGAYALLKDNEDIILLELETGPKPYRHNIIKVKKKTAVYYSDDTGKLYYLEPERGKLYFIEIVPKSRIVPMNFPNGNNG